VALEELPSVDYVQGYFIARPAPTDEVFGAGSAPSGSD
jgi:EAL domain-containing protein (putative c-di-GMP-specific phosphodiesterase class I)